MKKVFSIFIVLFVLTGSLFAEFTFSFGPHDPYYNPKTLDPYGFDGSKIRVFYMTGSNHEGNNMMIENSSLPASDPDHYQIIDYRDFNDDYNLMLNMRLSAGASVLRFGWPGYVMADLALQGLLNSVFVLAGGTDTLGFDGSLFFGGELRLFDMVTLRAGLRHYSGHVGDEILNDAMRTLGRTDWGPVDYVRDNMIELSVGYDGIKYFDAWFSFIMPNPGMWWSPYFHQPDWIHTTTDNPQYTSERNPEQWDVRGPYGNGYGGYILQLDLNGDQLVLQVVHIFVLGLDIALQ